MQLEAVGGISVGDLSLEIRGQIDNVDGIEGALLRTDTAANAEALGDEGNFGLGRDLDTQLASADHGAGLFAFLSAFLKSRQRQAAQGHGNARTLGLHYTRTHAMLAIVEIFAEEG